MEAESKYTYVGLALVLLVAALVAGVIWLNRTGSRADFNYYTIFFERQPLDGLQIGADVDMRGIKIGRVEDYQLQSENINRVRVTVRTDERFLPTSVMAAVHEGGHALYEQGSASSLARTPLAGGASLVRPLPLRAAPRDADASDPRADRPCGLPALPLRAGHRDE